MLRASILAVFVVLATAEPVSWEGMKPFTDFGIAAALMWFLYYTVSKWIPSIEKANERKLQEKDRLLVAVISEQRREFFETLQAQQAQFRQTLDAIRAANIKERRANRTMMKRVVAAQRLNAEALVRAAGLMDKYFKDMEDRDALRRQPRGD